MTRLAHRSFQQPRKIQALCRFDSAANVAPKIAEKIAKEFAKPLKWAPEAGCMVFVAPDGYVYVIPDINVFAAQWFVRRRDWFVGVFTDETDDVTGLTEALEDHTAHWVEAFPPSCSMPA
jgi:hypothetical protein